jgi:hypothetical protein
VDILKKILFSILFVTSLVLTQDSQLKVVGEPKQLEGGIIPKDKRDANGRVCAGLMIFSDVKGLKYDASNGLVGDVKSEKPGQDLLFLQPDEALIEVFCTDYKPLKILLSDIGIRLESGKIWSITIEGEKFIPVNFIITPNGTRLIVDNVDKDLSKSPQLKIGKHVIKISKQGYETIVDTLSVSETNALFAYNLKEKIGAAKRDVPDFSIPVENTYGASAVIGKFTEVGGVASYEMTDVRNSFLSAVMQSGKYDVSPMTEDELSILISETSSGSMTERDRSVKIGQSKKTGIVFSASVSKTSGSKYIIVFNMYDVRSTSIVKTEKIEVEGYLGSELSQVEIAAQKLIGVYEEPSYTWYYIGGAVLVGGAAAAVLLQPEKIVPPVIDNSLPNPPDKPSN